ncbi:MAG: hypothetical protein Q8N63_06325 [Nanoarchaeota archaeon]|nr:hypothetical protein [Nanoarchaeota archaeon]
MSEFNKKEEEGKPKKLGIFLTIVFVIALQLLLYVLIYLHTHFISENLFLCKGEECMGMIVLVPLYLIISSIIFFVTIYKFRYKGLIFCATILFVLFLILSITAAMKDYNYDKKVFLESKDFIFNLDKSIVSIAQENDGGEICLTDSYIGIGGLNNNNELVLIGMRPQFKLFRISGDFQQGNIKFNSKIIGTNGESPYELDNVFTINYEGKYDINLLSYPGWSLRDIETNCQNGLYIKNDGTAEKYVGDISTGRPMIIIKQT